jgi:hypothetical protein
MERFEEVVGCCGGCDILSLLSERRYEHVKDRGCKRVFPDHRIKEIPAFEIRKIRF